VHESDLKIRKIVIHITAVAKKKERHILVTSNPIINSINQTTLFLIDFNVKSLDSDFFP